MRLTKGLFLFPIILAGAACGLPDAYYLEPPVADPIMSQTTSYCEIAGTGRTSDTLVTFMGYELYYKLYGAPPKSDLGFQSVQYTYSDLQNAGFFRVCRGPGSLSALGADTTPGTASAPLVDISVMDPGSIGNNFTVNIYFNQSAPAGFGLSSTANVSFFVYYPPSTSTATNAMEIRRYAQADPSLGNVCKTFAPDSTYPFPNFTPGDTDGVTATMRTDAYNNGGILYIMMYAVSYGKADDGTYIRSSPTYLGYTQLYVISN
jgi:hypothetical protein